MSINLNRYKYKNRVIILETPNYKNQDYLDAKQEYENNIDEYNKRYVKLLTKQNKDSEFFVILVGFDGYIKKTLKTLDTNRIIRFIDKMPMAKILKKNPQLKPSDLF